MQSSPGTTARNVRSRPPVRDVLTWNCGGLSTTWAEILSVLSQEKCAAVRLCVLVEMHWKRGIPISVSGLESPEPGLERAQCRDAGPDP